MTAHDPRVSLTEAEVERLCDALEDCDAEYRVEQRVAREVEHLIAARLAPIRALAENYDGWEIDEIDVPWIALADLRAALDAPVSASQDHDWHQPLTHCHCGRVIPCRHHDGAEGQGEGGKAGEGVRCNRHGQLDRSVCGFCHDAYVECTRCGVYSCPCNTFPCEPEDAPR